MGFHRVAQAGLELLDSQSAGIIGVNHHARPWLIFYFVEMLTPCVVQTGLKLLSSSNPPASASQSTEITGMSHSAWPQLWFSITTGKALGGRVQPTMEKSVEKLFLLTGHT